MADDVGFAWWRHWSRDIAIGGRKLNSTAQSILGQWAQSAFVQSIRYPSRSLVITYHQRRYHRNS